MDKYLEVIKECNSVEREDKERQEAYRAARILAYLEVFIRSKKDIPIFRKFVSNNKGLLGNHAINHLMA